MPTRRILSVFWHGIVSDATPEAFDNKDPSVAQFEAQIEFLIGKFTPVSIWEFLEIMDGERSRRSYSKPPVLLGFDDGLRSVITRALPVLTRYGVPSVFFVLGTLVKDPDFLPWFVEVKQIVRRARRKRITWRGVALDLARREDRLRARSLTLGAFRACASEEERQRVLNDLAGAAEVDRPRADQVDDDFRFATREDLAQVRTSSGMAIASHAMTHRYLEDLGAEEQRCELVESDAMLRAESPAYCPVVAYPAGSFNEVTLQIASGIYRAGFGVSEGVAYANRWAYPRIGLGGGTARDVAYVLNPMRLKLVPIKRWLRRSGLLGGRR